MSTAPAAPKQAPLAPSRMRLDALVRGKQQQRLRAVVYGPEGVGKSTLGAGAPKPIFLGAEDGTAQLDVTRFPAPESWEDIIDAVRVLATETHDYETLVIDTLDWVEPLIWAHVCKRDGEKNIEAYGYGKGYQVALDEWRRLLAALDRLRAQRPMHLVLLAHSAIRPFKNPAGEDFDRYELKLQQKAAGLLKEWPDLVLFANHEILAKKDEKTKRVKGVTTNARYLYTERSAAFDAKSRYPLPAELPLSWSELEAAVNAGQVASPEVLAEEIRRKAKGLPAEREARVLEALAKAGTDAGALVLVNNKLNAALSGGKEQ